MNKKNLRNDYLLLRQSDEKWSRSVEADEVAFDESRVRLIRRAYEEWLFIWASFGDPDLELCQFAMQAVKLTAIPIEDLVCGLSGLESA